MGHKISGSGWTCKICYFVVLLVLLRENELSNKCESVIGNV